MRVVSLLRHDCCNCAWNIKNITGNRCQCSVAPRVYNACILQYADGRTDEWTDGMASPLNMDIADDEEVQRIVIAESNTAESNQT